MKYVIMILLVLAALQSVAQTNLVKNPDMEQYNTCPDGLNQIKNALGWSSILDSASEVGGEYFNVCSNVYSDGNLHIPLNAYYYQYPHSDSGMIGGTFYYDKTSPPPPSPLPLDYRDYAQGRLYKALTAGKTYCVAFWLNLTEASAYAHNMIGAYLDDGSINKLPLATGSEVTSVSPQVYSTAIIKDTANWVKVEGSFTATGNETYISIGTFATNAMISTTITSSGLSQYSYYLLDDVSVVPIDWTPEAGPDTWVEVGMEVAIGDSTAEGMDSKWYHKGSLIDSGGRINVKAGSSSGQLDTYVVQQTVCGIVKTDTVVVRTVPVGVKEYEMNKAFSIYPNPSGGAFTISPVIPNGAQRSEETLHIKVYDLPGRVVYEDKVKDAFRLDAAEGLYMAEIRDSEGRVHRERLAIRH